MQLLPASGSTETIASVMLTGPLVRNPYAVAVRLHLEQDILAASSWSQPRRVTGKHCQRGLVSWWLGCRYNQPRADWWKSSLCTHPVYRRAIYDEFLSSLVSGQDPDLDARRHEVGHGTGDTRLKLVFDRARPDDLRCSPNSARPSKSRMNGSLLNCSMWRQPPPRTI